MLVGFLVPNSQLLHDKDLPEAPDIGCVEALLRKAANGGKIQAHADKLLHGTNHMFGFDVGPVPHSLGILVRADRTSIFNHVAWAPNLKLQELHSAEASLTRIELLLSDHCNLGDLTRGIQRRCVGKNCERFRLPPDTPLKRARER